MDGDEWYYGIEYRDIRNTAKTFGPNERNVCFVDSEEGSHDEIVNPRTFQCVSGLKYPYVFGLQLNR